MVSEMVHNSVDSLKYFLKKKLQNMKIYMQFFLLFYTFAIFFVRKKIDQQEKKFIEIREYFGDVIWGWWRERGP